MHLAGLSDLAPSWVIWTNRFTIGSSTHWATRQMLSRKSWPNQTTVLLGWDGVALLIPLHYQIHDVVVFQHFLLMPFGTFLPSNSASLREDPSNSPAFTLAKVVLSMLGCRTPCSALMFGEGQPLDQRLRAACHPSPQTVSNCPALVPRSLPCGTSDSSSANLLHVSYHFLWPPVSGLTRVQLSKTRAR